MFAYITLGYSGIVVLFYPDTSPRPGQSSVSHLVLSGLTIRSRFWSHGPKRNLAGGRTAVTITVTVGHFQLPIDREYSLASSSSSSSTTFTALQASSRQHPLPVHHISRLILNPNALQCLHPTLPYPYLIPPARPAAQKV